MGVHRVTELGWLFALAILWGASYTFIKIAVETVPPLTIVATRVSIAAVLLLVVVRYQGLRMPRDARTWRAFFVPFTLISWGEQFIDSSLAGILNATPPLFTFALTRLWTRHESATSRQLIAVLLGTAGVVLIVGTDALGGLGQHSLAELAITAASVCYALAAIWGHRLAHLSPVVSTAGTMTCAAVVMMPVSVAFDRPWTLAPSVIALAALMGLAVLSTTIASMIYFHLLRTLGSIGTTSNSYLRAAASLVLGMVMLGERPSVSATSGLVLVFAGVVTVVGEPTGLHRPTSTGAANRRVLTRP
jgi:drug/metabolite transporter (DMT)-like permease